MEEEQEQRQLKATEQYNQDIKIRKEDLAFNEKEIKDLEEQLRVKKEEAENRRKELRFQEQVQLRSQKVGLTAFFKKIRFFFSTIVLPQGLLNFRDFRWRRL